MRNILKGYMYAENIFANISIYCHYIDTFQNILKYIDTMTTSCGLFHLLNTVLDLLNIHIYTLDILRGSHNNCQ